MTELDSLRMTLGQTRALQLQSTTFRIEKQTELETRVNSVYLTGHENQFQVAPHLKLVIMVCVPLLARLVIKLTDFLIKG